jgi:hypothetical protein
VSEQHEHDEQAEQDETPAVTVQAGLATATGPATGPEDEPEDENPA